MARPPNAQQLFTRLIETPHPLERQLAAWLEAPAFRAFAQTHERKIRRKLRLARDAESQADLAWELEIAFRLAQAPGFALAYELGGSGDTRIPDFTLTFRGHTIIGIEATRMRAINYEPAFLATKIGEIVLAKLSQLYADSPNLVAIQVAETSFAQLDLAATLRTLRQRADARDAAVLQRRGFEQPAAFYRLFRRLGAVIVASHAAPPQFWLNPQAQRPLPEQARKQLIKAFEP